MAVSIDTVYQRVLAIANKEQRGYITPQQFNLFANQVQLRIFEQYFYELDKFLRLPGNDSAYSDRINILEEKIAFFEKNKVPAVSLDGTTLGPELQDNLNFVISGTLFSTTSTQLAVIQVAGQEETVYSSASGTLQLPGKATTGTRVEFVPESLSQFPFGLDSGSEYSYLYTITSNGGSNDLRLSNVPDGSTYTSLPSTPGVHSVKIYATADRLFLWNADENPANQITFSKFYVKEVQKDEATLPTDVYRLGTVFYKDGLKYIRNVNITAKEADLMEQTALYKATTIRPNYVRLSSSKIKFYPVETIPARSTGNISFDYVAKPTKVEWGYNIVLGQALYDASKTTDFELHPSEETSLVFEILALAGIMMEDPGLINISNQEEASNNQQELM